MSQQNLGRSWGTRFDSLPSNLESDFTRSHHATSSGQMNAPDDEGRVAQDASIFVGSLPSNIDHAELTSMLSQHLSGHPEVRTIKVVRDSKGGTCAFIQCQDAGSAVTLMNNIYHSTPRLFMGRHLRYEPARVFRTLLISYRSPRQYIRQGDDSKRATLLASEDNKHIELELPTAMRIVRTPGTKPLSIFYNSEATADSPFTADGNSGLLLAPLLYDAESLMQITSVFGTVENFGVYNPEHEDGQAPSSLPAPTMALVHLLWIQAVGSHQAGSGLRASSHVLTPSQSFPAGMEDSSLTRHFSGAKNNDPAPLPGSSSGLDNRALYPSRPRALSLTHNRPQPAVPLSSLESTGQLSYTGLEPTNRTRWADHVDLAEFKRSSSVLGPAFLSPPCFGPTPISSAEIGPHASQEDEGREFEADLPPTSGSGASPITPRTPGSLTTPITGSYVGDVQSMSLKDCEGQSSRSRPPREKGDDTVVDPTTIFVGGLDMFGPIAWDEEKVRAMFSKYGRVETVKVIHPINKRSAFAFVKFDNTDSPMRAVREEHNRPLGGRLIRVQLRDWNPPHRTSWRSARGKERDSPSQLDASDAFRVNPNLPRPRITSITEHMTGLQLIDSSPHHAAPTSPADAPELNETNDDIRTPEPSVQTTTDDCASGSAKPVPTTDYPSGSGQGPAAPSPHIVYPTQSSMIQAPVLPSAYPFPSIPYYPQPWIPGYGPQFQFQMPFAGQPYPGYPFPPPVVPAVPQSSGPDGETPPNIPAPCGPPPGSSYPVYAPYPSSLGHPGLESGPSNPGPLGTANSSGNLRTQPPVIPTGFIQGDQGMLVPVYPPEALNQYMTGNQDPPPPGFSGSTEGQHAVAWHPYPPVAPVNPQALVFHPYIGSALPPPAMGNHGWIPGHGWPGVPPPPPPPGHAQGVPGHPISSSPAGGPATVTMTPTSEHNPPSRRQNRRQNPAGHHKNNFARGGRPPRGSLNSSRSTPNVQSAVTHPSMLQSDTSTDGNWQQWNTD
ncbi:hypothetical protein BU15DRAFT_70822 [Melanogaster broomeanus]|nr:hypothetical protein BU15DRAFT_70822 [Melanogaster broomeanus]